MSGSDGQKILEEIKKSEWNVIDRCKQVSRDGLYFMVLMCWMQSCHNDNEIERLKCYPHFTNTSCRIEINTNIDNTLKGWVN